MVWWAVIPQILQVICDVSVGAAEINDRIVDIY
jgi:hypothetical protein